MKKQRKHYTPEEKVASARFVVRRPREERRAKFIVADEAHNFRIADHPDTIRITNFK